MTERDKRILKTLQSYALLTTRQLRAKVFPGVASTTVLRRLRALEAAGYVQRIEGLPSTERAWGVSKRSAEMETEQPSKVHFPRHSLDHDLKLTELRLRLEGQGIALSWIPEHEIRTKIARAHGLRTASRMVIPDALMGVDIDGLNESVAVELELNFKNSTRYGQIFHDYQDKKNLYAVWYVVSSKAIGRHLSKCHRAGYYDRSLPYLFWSVVEDVMSEPLAAKLWVGEDEHLVSDFFTENPAQPAHSPAQGVSTLAGSAELSQPEPSAENNSEITETRI